MRESVKHIFLTFLLIGLLPLLWAESSWDGEKLELEINMQRRVETALSKLLPEGQFVVVVQVEPWKTPIDASGKPVVIEEGYYLPGVPARKRIDGSAEAMQDLVESLRPEQKVFMHFVRRISATVVLDEDLDDSMVRKIRDLTRQILGLDAKRGDTLTIERSVFSKPTIPIIDNSTFSRLQRSLRSYWLIVSLAIILVCVVVFFLFVFGPLRGFLNRFVQILPTLKPVEDGGRVSRFNTLESQILPALLSHTYGNVNPSGVAPGQPAIAGSLTVENPNKKTVPFGFIREDHLSNLATLLSREIPEKAAVVLGYLPPEWISRILSKMEPGMQAEITEHLATTRQLLPEQVEDIEQDLKRRLDYLIGGPERVIAVYESLDPEGQRNMLETMKDTRPDLAEQLMRRTFAFESLDELDGASLKTVLREVDLQTLVTSLRGMSDDFQNKVLGHLSPGKAEIVKEELEFADGPVGKTTLEARRKVALLVRRLEREGQIQLPGGGGEDVPVARYGSSLKTSLKMPQGFLEDKSDSLEGETIDELSEGGNIEDRIQEFMNRRQADKERFPVTEDDTQFEPPQKEAS